MLVSVLLITLILITLGLAFLGKRAIQYRRAAAYEQAVRARALAESGLEDALTKLRRDLEFPPLSKDQSAFSYTEQVTLGAERIGSYRVTLDGRWRFPPYSIWVITSQGEVGGVATNPSAKRSYRAEFDVSKHQRNDPTPRSESQNPTNPYFFQVINFQDLGGL